METNLQMLENLFEPLSQAAQHLQHVTLLQGTKAYGAHIEPFPVPARERWPRHQHENFYWLQEDYLRDKQKGQDWHWTILRPQIIFGESLGSNLNAIPALGVYAALLREAGKPLSFPGGAPWLTEAVDADLLARACEWAGTTSLCRNEAYNMTNGDVFVWQNVWPTIAEALGMEVGAPQPCRLAEEMPKRESEWAAIVRKYNLRAPASLRDYVGQSFIFADAIFAYGAEQPPPAMLVSTIKARQHGFHECMDTEDMFRKWFKRFQDLRLLPPV
jgi:nucleoside-diphosphate-sugar epimerase